MKTIAIFVSALLVLSACDLNSRTDQEEFVSANFVMTTGIQSPETTGKAPEKREVMIEKDLTYDKHTLEDTYPYKDTVRVFQWDKIKSALAYTEELASRGNRTWAVVQNKRDIHGSPPLTRIHHKNEYNVATDNYGVDQYQAVPLYLENDLRVPERYDYDGSLVEVLEKKEDFVRVKPTNFEGEYYVPERYIHYIEETPAFGLAIVIDRKNQNISTYERLDDVWKVRSMNPCTTGAHNPPMQKETPLGLFMIQNKLKKMYYYVDGTTDIGGFAPWASRFCEGAYIHGVPVNKPRTEIIEYSNTLGTVPRSHMCVRNASSHAKFIYDNFPADHTLVYVIE